jgi:hypothetical protein
MAEPNFIGDQAKIIFTRRRWSLIEDHRLSRRGPSRPLFHIQNGHGGQKLAVPDDEACADVLD